MAVYVFLANGFEETEALLPSDLLSRAGIEVWLVGVPENGNTDMLITGSHNIVIKTSHTLNQVNIEDAQALLLPGGLPGADNLAKNSQLIELISQQVVNKGIIAAICAAPARVLGAHGFLSQKRFTCYPGQESYIKDGYYINDSPVVQDGLFITSQGVGTAAHFGYALIKALKDEDTALEVWKNTLYSTDWHKK